MEIALNNFDKFIVVGDRILVKPQEESGRTTSGLYLPAGVTEKEKVQSCDGEMGFILSAFLSQPGSA